MKNKELADKFLLATTDEGVGTVFSNDDYERAAAALITVGALIDEHAEDVAAGLCAGDCLGCDDAACDDEEGAP